MTSSPRRLASRNNIVKSATQELIEAIPLRATLEPGASINMAIDDHTYTIHKNVTRRPPR